MIEKMNNFRQAKVDGKDDWNNALEQSACKVDTLLSSLDKPLLDNKCCGRLPNGEGWGHSGACNLTDKE